MPASRDTATSSPDTPLWKAVVYIAEKIGEVKGTTFFPRTRALIEEKAIAGELRIWGRKQLDADPEWVNTRKFAIRHTPIPSDYWSISQLAPYCTVEPVMEDKDHNRRVVDNVPCTQEADKGTWPRKRNRYADLRVSQSQVETLWETNARLSERRDRISARNQLSAKTFSKGLTAWREWIVSLQERLCRDLVAIAFANRGCLGQDPLVWVNECIDNYWSTHRPGFRNWAALCCDWADPETWIAPGWLLSEVPQDILRGHIQTAPLAETLDGRVFPPYTEVIRAQIASLIEMRILMARTAVLDDAKIKIASQPAPKRARKSESSVQRVNEGIFAIARRYGDEWNRKWLESTRELYAALHPALLEPIVGVGVINSVAKAHANAPEAGAFHLLSATN